MTSWYQPRTCFESPLHLPHEAAVKELHAQLGTRFQRIYRDNNMKLHMMLMAAVATSFAFGQKVAAPEATCTAKRLVRLLRRRCILAPTGATEKCLDNRCVRYILDKNGCTYEDLPTWIFDPETRSSKNFPPVCPDGSNSQSSSAQSSAEAQQTQVTQSQRYSTAQRKRSQVQLKRPSSLPYSESQQQQFVPSTEAAPDSAYNSDYLRSLTMQNRLTEPLAYSYGMIVISPSAPRAQVRKECKAELKSAKLAKLAASSLSGVASAALSEAASQQQTQQHVSGGHDTAVSSGSFYRESKHEFSQVGAANTPVSQQEEQEVSSQSSQEGIAAQSSESAQAPQQSLQEASSENAQSSLYSAQTSGQQSASSGTWSGGVRRQKVAAQLGGTKGGTKGMLRSVARTKGWTRNSIGYSG
ncbi:hypothetical protein MTO96_009943 [Rhipicephalus appendiculatus]